MPSLERFVRPIMEIRRGEWSKTILMALYFYLTITAYYVLKPARNSLYINYLGANRIPDAILLIAVISYFVVLVYTHYSKKIEHNKIVTGFLLISIGCLLFFRWAFQLQSHAHAPLISFLFFIWVTLFSSIIVMQFWVLANDVFDSQAAKRLYGFVGSGGIWGGITGGFIAMQAKQLHTENLLLVACGYIGLMIVIYNIIWHREEHNFVTRGMEKRIEDGYTQRQLFSFFKQSKYLLLVLIIVCLIKFVTVQTEWQYNKFVEIQISGKDARTVFFGQILASLSVVALAIQLLFTSKVLKKFNFHGALLPLPVGLIFGTVSLLFFPVLGAASILKISDGSLRYSINQTATNYLYLPITRHIRYKVKPFIDVCVYHFAKGMGAIVTRLYLYVMISFFAASNVTQASAIGYINIIFLIVWFVIIAMLKKEYPHEIRRFLKENKVSDSPQGREDKDFAKELFDKNQQDILRDYKDLLASSHKRSVNVRLAVCVALYEGRENTDSFKKIIHELVKAEDIEHGASVSNTQDAVNELLSTLTAQKDTSLRFSAIKRLNKLRVNHVELAFNQDIIYKAIVQEIKDYYKSFTVFSLYEALLHQSELDTSQKDFLSVALRTILDETFERVFRLLGLLYNPVDIHTVYEGLMKGNVYVRANSLELLDNIIAKKVKKKITPIIDGELSLFGPERAGYFTSKMQVARIDALRDALYSGDRWLCVCALFMAEKFKLHELYTDIEEVLYTKDALCREVASFIYTKITDLKAVTRHD